MCPDFGLPSLFFLYSCQQGCKIRTSVRNFSIKIVSDRKIAIKPLPWAEKSPLYLLLMELNFLNKQVYSTIVIKLYMCLGLIETQGEISRITMKVSDSHRKCRFRKKAKANKHFAFISFFIFQQKTQNSKISLRYFLQNDPRTHIPPPNFDLGIRFIRLQE